MKLALTRFGYRLNAEAREEREVSGTTLRFGVQPTGRVILCLTEMGKVLGNRFYEKRSKEFRLGQCLKIIDNR